MIKLILTCLLFSFASYAEIKVLKDGNINATDCAYGRGQAVITQASDNATAELERFIKENKLLNFDNDGDNIDINLSQIYNTSRGSILEGFINGEIQLDISKPYLQGNDTCIVVAINIQNPPETNSSDEFLEWNNDKPTVTVIVIGEGWPKADKSARQNAEQDALKRAISRVVGIYLEQNTMQSSQTIVKISNGDESSAIKDLMSQQLSSRSKGLVKSWQPLASKNLANDGLQVTLQVVVEKSPLIAQSANFIAQIGSPRVEVLAPNTLEPILKTWLSEHGIETGPGASIKIIAKHKLTGPISSNQLSITVEVRDLADNLYGRWQNDPSLVTLPYSSHVLDDLIKVAFEMPQQQQDLQKVLSKAFLNIINQGGLVRNIKIRSNHLKQPEILHSLISSIAGIKDVTILTKNQYLIASVRYIGSTGELVSILQSSLTTISKSSLPHGQVINDQTILFN